MVWDVKPVRDAEFKDIKGDRMYICGYISASDPRVVHINQILEQA